MTVKLWQIFATIAWLASLLGFAVADQLPTTTRVAASLLLTAIVFTFGRSIFPRPPIRQHIDNEAQLQRLNDLILFGVPAFFLYLISFSMLSSNILFGFILTIIAMIAYYLRPRNKPEN